MKALVLSGGGALGAYEAGVIEGFHRAGKFDYDLVCGTSIGALNAAFVAQHRFAELAATWHGIAKSRVITLTPSVENVDNVRRLLSGIFLKRLSWQTAGELLAVAYNLFKLWPLEGLYKILGALAPEPIRNILRENLDFDRLITAVVISATNLTNGRSDAFWWFPTPADGILFAQRHDKGTAFPLRTDNFVQAVQASSSIPFAFAPVAIETTAGIFDQYVDGGVANNTPIGLAIDAGATDITIVYLNPSDAQLSEPMPNLSAIALACFAIMQDKILLTDVANAKRVNEAVGQSAAGISSSGAQRARIVIREIRPASALPITVLQFNSQDRIDQVYAQGLADVTAFLAVQNN